MINKHIIGVKITTTNENNQAQEDLAQLWKNFYDQANAELQTVKKEPYIRFLIFLIIVLKTPLKHEKRFGQINLSKELI